MIKKSISIFLLIVCFAVTLLAKKDRLDDKFRVKYNQILYLERSNPFHQTLMEKWLYNKLFDEKVTPDYHNWDVIVSLEIGNEIKVVPKLRIPYEKYLNIAFEKNFHTSLIEKNLELLTQKERENTGGLIPDIKLANFAIPKQIQMITGKAASKIRIDGSQKITFSGSSTKKENNLVSELNNNSNFDLKMKQELKLGLHGTIGDKISVDINHNSNVDDQIFDPNNISLKYEGYEDEVVKSVEAGNISLALKGSRYLSVSGSSKGLFGVKTEMQFGNLTLSTVASREEGEKTSDNYDGNSQSDSTVIWSKDFSELKHFFLINPYSLFDIYEEGELDPAGQPIPTGWVNNAIKMDEFGNWLINPIFASALPQEGSVRVFIDDNVSTNDILTVQGYDMDNPEFTYNFDELIEGTDYIVDYSSGLISLTSSVSKAITIGVMYIQENGNEVGSTISTPYSTKIIKRYYQENTDDTWDFEARNVYNLGMQNIKNEGFSLNIYNTIEGSSAINFDVPDTVNTGSSNLMSFTEYLNLDFNDDNQINGDDPAINLASGYIIFPFLKPFAPLGESVIYEKDNISITDDDIDMKISVKGKIGRETIDLRQLNILEDSEKVVVGGETMKKGVDYIIDYSMGSVTMLSTRAKNPDASIKIDYEYLPFFAIESKTLFGTRADWNISDRMKLGGTIIYQSEKVADRNPKIGNENRTLILADIDGEFKLEAPFITKTIDFIPFIRTDAESSFNLNGEIAMSVPKYFGHSEQNDVNEIYFDDMESILTSYPLNISRSNWVQASRPLNNYSGRSKIHWWNSDDFYSRDIYDEETLGDEEKDERVSVMTCKIVPPVIQPGSTIKPWSGLMRFIGDQVDLSKKEYIEVLAKVELDNMVDNNVTMHINLGTISEDFYTDFGGLGIMNSEDGLEDNDGVLTLDEDVGLDMVADGLPGDDPNDDSDSEEINNERLKINGTEGNGSLDTEDLNENGNLDVKNSYFQYSFQMNASSPYLVSNHDGWCLYRIPMESISSETMHDTDTGVPNIEKISYARMWFEPEKNYSPTKIHFASVEIVGNKWNVSAIKDLDGKIVSQEILDSNNETCLIGIADNKRDMHYTSPAGTTYETDGQKSKEQSLFLKIDNLSGGHQIHANQEFTDKVNLLNYGKMKFLVYLENAENNISYYENKLSAVIKIGADSTIYYEIEKPLEPNEYLAKMKKSNWYDFEIDFSNLTKLKQISINDTASHVVDGVKYSIFKNPNLDSIDEISLGIRNNSNQTFSGTIFFDDIRVKDPYDDIGYASRLTLNSKFADFSTLDITTEWKTDNFMSSNKRSRNSSQDKSKQEKQDLSITNVYHINKFFPDSWGLKMPLNLSRSESKGIPRFKANSDILREDLVGDERDRQKTYSLNKSVGFSFSKGGKTDNWFVKYLINGTSMSGSVKLSESKNPTAADSTLTYNSRYKYVLNIPKDKVSFSIKKYKIFYFPNVFNNEMKFMAKYPDRWRWQEVGTDEPYWTTQENVVDEMTLNTTSSVDFDLTSDFVTKYSLTTDRDLMKTEFFEKVNIGQETGRKQSIDLSYKPKYLEDYFTYNVSSKINYNEKRKKKSATSTSTDDLYSFSGDVSRKITGSVKLKNSDMFTRIAKYFDANVNVKKGREDTPEIKKADEDKKEDNEEGSNQTNLEEEQREQEFIEQERIEQEKIEQEKIEQEKLEQEKLEQEKLEQEKLEKEKLDSENKKNEDETNKDDEPEKKDEDSDKSEKKENKRELNTSFFVAKTFSFLARLDNISISASDDYSTSYTQLETPPGFSYQLSLPDILSEEDMAMKRKGEGINVNTGLLIFKNLSTSWKFSYNKARVFTGSKTESQDYTFPDISANLTNVQDMITTAIGYFGSDYKFNSLLTSSSFTSGFSRKVTKDGKLNFTTPKSESIRNNFSPLIGWTGNWSFDLQSSLRYSYSESESITHMGDYDNKTTSVGNTLNGSFNYSFDISRGVTIPYINKTIKLKNQLTANLNYTYSYDKTTSQNKEDTLVSKEDRKFTVSPGLSYQFHKNIKGGMNSNYSWTDNIKRDEKIKIFDLSFWVEISF